jgi:predicted metalloprotease with PDZ domain
LTKVFASFFKKKRFLFLESFSMRILLLVGICTFAVWASRAHASQAAPAAAAPLPPAVGAPQDRPYAGTIDLRVDATDLGHHVFNVVETIPVAEAGPMTLLYPKWIPGTHSPTGPIASLAGLKITANGRDVAWLRDVVDPYAFHVEVPAGVTALNLAFQYVSPTTPREGDVVMTARIFDLQWNQEILYPAGYYVRDIGVRPRLVLPSGWQFGTALGQESRLGDTVTFNVVPMDVLLDSPVYAGRYFARFDLAPGAAVPVHLNVVADQPEDLAIKPEDLAAHRNLVAQAALNFASQHYDHFDFLLSLSSEITWRGLEHHRSSENGQDRGYFTQPATTLDWRDLLPHEYTHSWDGKFRRPEDLWSPDYNIVPERGSLLWVYEGQTEYWGQVLAARAGLMTPAQFRDEFAVEAAALQAEAGRDWRNVQDTTNDPVINQRRPQAWPSWSRNEDYYEEGLFIWLDADTLIREKTGGAKSLTSFAQNFFGIDNGNYGEVTYGFDDVVNALNAIYPYDWRNFLRTRLDTHPNTALLDGLNRSGWRLVFTDNESAVQKAFDAYFKGTNFAYSLGLALGADGNVFSVEWGGPAYHAGLSRGVKLVAVNGLALDAPSDLADAITKAKADHAPIELLVLDGKYYRTISIDYHGGLRFPHLERIPDTPDRLSDIIAPLKAAADTKLAPK